VHRSLKRLIQAKKSPDKRSGVNFEALGEWTSQKERRAVEAERFIVRRKQCWYMQQHLGAEFKGQISGVSEKGVFVLIPEFVLDGFLPLDSMSEAYSYNENKKCMQARSGKKTLSLGDSLFIQVVRVSVDDGQIEFGEAP
jgi:ribonuclease R